MNRILAFLGLIAVAAVPLWCQVQVLNSASLQPGLPSGGALATIFFTVPFELGFSPGSFTAPPSGPLPFTLGGVGVRVNEATAPILAVDIPSPDKSPYGRIDFQVPMARNGTIQFGLDTGFSYTERGTLEVGRVDSGGYYSGLYVLTQLPQPALGGFFSDGHGYASAQHASDGSFVTTDNPAHPGDTIIAFADDFYDVWPPVAIGLPVPQENSYHNEPRTTGVRYPYPSYLYLQNYPPPGGFGANHVGTEPLQILFQGLSAGQIGVEEIHFVVPPNQAPGDWALFFFSKLPEPILGSLPGRASPYVLLPVR